MGLSQSELARRATEVLQKYGSNKRHTPGYVCDLERGRGSVRLRTLAIFAEALGVTPASLISAIRHSHGGT
jgi:transcriptional regulator with XRE-family HTH domain